MNRIILLFILFLCINIPTENAAENKSFFDDLNTAILINNDPSPRHVENIQHANNCLQRWGFQAIFKLGDQKQPPRLNEIKNLLLTLPPDRPVFIYLTGHGHEIFNQKNPEGQPCLMLRDHPLTPELLVQWLGERPLYLYSDQCFAPGFHERLQSLLCCPYILWSDKNPEQPESSCRGISTRFWDILSEYAQNSKYYYGENSFQTAIMESWRVACPDGSLKRSE